MEENIRARWAQVDNQLQRRADLIPNLVETVKGYASHEREVLGRVADARAKLAGARSVNDRIAADNELSSALARLLVVVENYPNLKADSQFTGLRTQLEGTENRLAVERRRYNEAVQGYNTTLRRFPGSLVASLAGFRESPYFQVPEAARAAPQVKF
ncbi:MAG: LemA family protein [Deltaproteobacteria bacterium]|nr:LemA family protein [Deltaproteobacteria bacterium]MBI3076664.1 LemA family protein [Deltaproteobacteria bacterium]